MTDTGTGKRAESARVSAQGLVLLVSDVLAFTPREHLTSHGVDVLVRALRRSLHSDVSQADEEGFFKEMLDAGLETCVPFDYARSVRPEDASQSSDPGVGG